jgi:hypothetical protein
MKKNLKKTSKLVPLTKEAALKIKGGALPERAASVTISANLS